jgi:chromate transporter
LSTQPRSEPAATEAVTFAAALRVWIIIGFINFGGPAGQIALMHKMLVEQRKWLSETRFLHALNYCMLLPGPEAQQLAVYIGWLMHKTWGGLVAGLCFILPGFVLMLVISMLYVSFGQLSWMQGLLFGMQAATLAIVLEAVLRIGKKALKRRWLYGVSALSFVAIFVFGLPFPVIIGAAALTGLLIAKFAPHWLAATVASESNAEDFASQPAHVKPSLSSFLTVLLIGLVLWATPVLFLLLYLGPAHVFTEESLFFSKMSVVTFGGAYAVLAYMTQQAVQHYGWLSTDEMVQGLALAETTPGPLILVLTYVGFLGAYRAPGGLDPMLAGVLGATISTWVTFVPCFLWIFLGAPYIERLRGNRWLNAALSVITAAVVGVIANLSIWFALHVLFHDITQWHAFTMTLPIPAWRSLDLSALALSALAMLMMLKWHVGLIRTLLLCAVLGLLLKSVG